jgi:hypothetical protein
MLQKALEAARSEVGEIEKVVKTQATSSDEDDPEQNSNIEA